MKNVLCASTSGATSGIEIEELLKSSGNPELDKGLISEMNLQSAFFGYRPAFILYSGGEKNAFATPEEMPQTRGTDGTIFYNLEMLKEQLLVPKWGGAILSGVIAHEFGHIYQNFGKALGRLRALGTTVKFVELHADFLSGFYMGGKDRNIDVKPYADAFFKIGDYEFTQADHHGTPEERYFVLKAGYNFRRSQTSATIASASDQAEKVLQEYIH